MPSRPGSFPVTMEAQAGQVMEGMVLSSSPYSPCPVSRLMVGSSSSQRSKTSSGGAASRPMITTLSVLLIGLLCRGTLQRAPTNVYQLVILTPQPNLMGIVYLGGVVNVGP